MKINSGILYAFFGYWSKRPVGEWPGYLKNLIKMAKNDDYFIYIPNEKGNNNPLIRKLFVKGYDTAYWLTRYCIEKVYTKEINNLKLKLFDDRKNFLKTYVHADKRAERFTKSFRSKSPQEVTTLAHIYPAMKYIFETLHVI